MKTYIFRLRNIAGIPSMGSYHFTNNNSKAAPPDFLLAIRSTVAAQAELLRQKCGSCRLLYCHDLIFMQLDASFWTRLASASTT